MGACFQMPALRTIPLVSVLCSSFCRMAYISANLIFFFLQQVAVRGQVLEMEGHLDARALIRKKHAIYICLCVLLIK